MPVAGGPNITKTGILLEVDAANASSYSSGSSTWVNVFRPGTNNGTINGTIGFNSTDSYGALTFPGTASSFVDFGNVGDLSSAWSFQVAVKPAPSASGVYTILSYTSGSGTGSLTFELDYSSSTQTAVLMAFSSGSGAARAVHTITGSVPTGSWSIINASYGSSLLALNINGIPTSFANTTGSTVGYSANNRLYLGGTFGTTSSFYSGSLASFFSYTSDIPGAQLINNYNAFATRFGRPPSTLNAIITDPDAYNFIDVVGIADATQQVAINSLVVGLKVNNLWGKMVAIYPFAGGTATSHKYNLKNINLYPVIWNGAVTHNSTGSFTNSTGYGNTGIIIRDILTNISSSAHISAYSNGQGVIPSYVNGFMGDTDGFTPTFGISISVEQQNEKRLRAGVFGSVTDNFYSGTIARGFFAVTRNSTTNVSSYVINPTDGVDVVSTTISFTSATSTPIWLLRDPSRTGGNIMSFATIGEGLTTGEMTTLYTLVQAYQTALGRNI